MPRAAGSSARHCPRKACASAGREAGMGPGQPPQGMGVPHSGPMGGVAVGGGHWTGMKSYRLNPPSADVRKTLLFWA